MCKKEVEKFYGVMARGVVLSKVMEHVKVLMDVESVEEIGKFGSRYIVLRGKWKSEESEREYERSVLSTRLKLGGELYLEYEVEVEDKLNEVCRIADSNNVTINKSKSGRVNIVEMQRVCVNLGKVDINSKEFKKFRGSIEKMPGVKSVNIIVK